MSGENPYQAPGEKCTEDKPITMRQLLACVYNTLLMLAFATTLLVIFLFGRPFP